MADGQPREPSQPEWTKEQLERLREMLKAETGAKDEKPNPPKG